MRLGVPLLLALPALVFLLVFFFAPFAILAVKSFYSPEGPTLRNYVSVLFDPFYVRMMVYSAIIAALTTAFTAVLAYPAAYFLAHVVSERYRGVFLAAMISPFWIDFLIRAYTLKALFALMNVEEGFFTLLYGMVYDYFPYMLLPLYASMTTIPANVISAARVQGASGMRLASGVVLPLTRPGLTAGALLVFMMSLTEFVIPAMLGGTAGYTLGYSIYDLFFTYRDAYRGSAISIFVSVLALFVSYYYVKAAGRRILG